MEKEEQTNIEVNNTEKPEQVKNENNKKQNKKNKPKKAPKAPVVEKKLKILCLHGYAQNLKVFQKRTAVLKKALKSVAELCKIYENCFIVIIIIKILNLIKIYLVKKIIIIILIKFQFNIHVNYKKIMLPVHMFQL